MADNIILLWDSPYSSVGGLVLQAAYIVCFSESFAAFASASHLLLRQDKTASLLSSKIAKSSLCT
jgi:hypothetical protein